MKHNEISKSNKAMDHRALLGSVFIAVLPICMVMTLVMVLTGSNIDFGTFAALPITICTAKASPNPLAKPNTIAVNIPGVAAGSNTRRIVCQRVAPKASEASFNSPGMARKASAATLAIVGNIIIANTIPPANTLKPKPPILFLIKGTNTLRPIQPYTTDGMPTNNSMTGCNNLCPHAGAILTIKIADAMLIGALIKIPNIDTIKEPRIKANAPTFGGTSSVCHWVEVKNSTGETPFTRKVVNPLDAIKITKENVTMITKRATKKCYGSS